MLTCGENLAFADLADVFEKKTSAAKANTEGGGNYGQVPTAAKRNAGIEQTTTEPEGTRGECTTSKACRSTEE
eukprot:g11883.t1